MLVLLVGTGGWSAVVCTPPPPMPPKDRPLPKEPIKVEDLAKLWAEAERLVDHNDMHAALKVAVECMEKSTVAEAQTPGRVFPPYYRALCQTVDVRTKMLGAPKAAKALLRDAEEAVRRDASFDQGGPLRLLGMFYLRAPRWPKGPGDQEKGASLLKRAREQFPNHPLNRLFYAEALIALGENDKAKGELVALEKDRGTLDPKWQRLYTRLRDEVGN